MSPEPDGGGAAPPAVVKLQTALVFVCSAIVLPTTFQ
jgi:hypothetical protein